ncbi:MAG: ATP synthase F1 subunit gamma [Candidatus Omnitrophota bacterium]
MILSLRQIKRRIRSVESTKKITRAMQMISTVKLRHSENALYAGRPYFIKLDSILKKLLDNAAETANPLLEERAEKKKFTLCLIASDGGLCSVYNDAVIRIAENFIDKCGKENVHLISVGRKGFTYFKKKGVKIPHAYIGLNGRCSGDVADEIGRILINAFLSKEADEVYVAHTHFDATLRYKPKLQKFLNLRGAKETAKLDYILEPDMKKLLEELIPRYLLTKIRLLLLDAFTSEHSQRMVAMKTATDNAMELIDTLTLFRNKVRQTSITKEVLEVSSAVEALKG